MKRRWTIAVLFKGLIIAGFIPPLAVADLRPYQQDAIGMLKELVSYRTVKGSGTVPVLAAYLRREFLAAGFSESDIHIIPMQENTASMVVRYRSVGESDGAPILLMAHMDIVDAYPSDWEQDPFTLVERDGYFYGRGVSDNKSGVATLSNTFIRLKREGFQPDRDLIIAFTGDEEDEMKNIQELIVRYRDLVNAEFALNADAGGGKLDEKGEPYSFVIQAGEKTEMNFDFVVRNRGGHSSEPRKDNAIYELADALQRVREYKFPIKYNDVTLNFFQQAANFRSEEVAGSMRKFAHNPKDLSAAEELSEHPDLAKLISTTCIPTILEAGHGLSALPQTARANVNCRVFPGVTVAEMREKLVGIVNDDRVEISVIGSPTAGPDLPVLPEVRSTVTNVVNSFHPGIPVITYMAPYATDGRETRSVGIPTYGVAGLFTGIDGNNEHGLNERLEVKAYLFSLDYWYRLLKAFSGAQ